MQLTRGLGFLLLLVGINTVAQSAPTAKPCTQPESKQLDFWVGEWDLTWPAPQSGQPAGRGTNTVRKELGGCVVEENFDGTSSNGLIGRSLSVFNARLGKWQQTWVDNQGDYLDFTGGWDGKEFLLSREGINPKGQKVQQRMIFKNITSDSFDWSWEISRDDGKTWQVSWPIHYQRKKS